MSQHTLSERLCGYDAICAVANSLLPLLQVDARLGRFWRHRGEDGVRREKQLLFDFLCSSAGGQVRNWRAKPRRASTHAASGQRGAMPFRPTITTPSATSALARCHLCSRFSNPSTGWSKNSGVNTAQTGRSSLRLMT